MSSQRKTWKLALTLVCIGGPIIAITGCDDPARVVGVPVHFTSHQLCSATFVAGLDPTQFYNEAIKPKLGPIRAFLRYEVDRQRQEVRAHFAGLAHSRAVYDGPFGCRVLHPGREARFFQGESDDREPLVVSPSLIADPGIVAPVNARLAEALDLAFAESASGPRRFTKAVVVLHRGRVVGERYAPGVTPTTPLIGWSMTKSVTNAILGVLVRNGKLDMQQPAPIAEWSAPGDPRRSITGDQLLRMVSGIGCGQSLETGFTTVFDADTQMEYDMADQSAFAANASLRAKPGTEWRYTNCNFVLLSRMIRDAAGGDAKSSRRFIERELFAPLGFEHATLEYDSAGVPLGTIHLWASARDWARLGLLYLRDGTTESGRRILPIGWVDNSARLTPQSADEYGYGAGFWTQRGDSAAARTRIAAGMPADSFMAVGSQGQYTIVIPSHDLVIVKIGWAYTPHDDHVAVERLVRETIAALPSESRGRGPAGQQRCPGDRGGDRHRHDAARPTTGAGAIKGEERKASMDVAATLEVLRKIPYFRSVPQTALQTLATSLRERRYHAGDVIFRKGDRSEGLGVVLHGRVRTVTISPEGREQVLKVFGPGRTFGDIPVFDDEPQPADAMAMSDSIVVFIPQSDLLACLRQHPDAAIEVLRLFASRLRAYKQMVEDLSLRTVVARVARLLVGRARGAQTLVEESPTSSPEYTQDEIAAMVGSVREVVQRALKTLEHAGLIQMARGRTQIIDLEALDGWAESVSINSGPEVPSTAVSVTSSTQSHVPR